MFISKLWKKYGFEISLIFVLITIIVIALFRIKKKGTWSKSYYMKLGENNNKPKHRPPQESKGEAECRRVLENYFNKPFPKARPNFLRNPITSTDLFSYNLELDCYNEELKLAVEFQGIQHYKYIPFMHKTKDAFYNQKYRDYLTAEGCSKNGVTLIEVPYTVKQEDIKNYLIERIENNFLNKWQRKVI